MKNIFILFILSTLAIPAMAYIPKFWTISSKLARSRGTKPLKIVQDVSVKDSSSGNTYMLRETIYVKNSREFKVDVTGKYLLENQVRASFLYKGKQKLFKESGVISKSNVLEDFYLPLLYARSADDFRKLLSQKGIVPDEALKAPKFSTFSGQNSEPPELFTHLSRTNGKISYAITKKLSTKSEVLPTIWVTQDKFHLSKFRLNQNNVVSFSNYKEYAKNLWHPQSQTILMEGAAVQISTVSVQPISESQLKKEFKKSTALKETPKLNFSNSTLEKFYSVFR